MMLYIFFYTDFQNNIFKLLQHIQKQQSKKRRQKINCMGLYDYNKILSQFDEVLNQNCTRANLKKEEYLDKIVMIFKQFIRKCEKQIDHILQQKIEKLSKNYHRVQHYLDTQPNIQDEQRFLIIAEFLIKPFQRFPFAGNKNEKLFKEQYNLIEKASVLIQQTLIQSFNEDEVPTFQNDKFFSTISHDGIGSQSLTKLRLNPQNFSINFLHEITPLQENISAVKVLNQQTMMLIGDSNYLQIWNIPKNYCVKQLFLQNPAHITNILVFKHALTDYIVLGYSDQSPIIEAYSLKNWSLCSQNITHTRQISKLTQYNQYLISGSVDGVVCLHSFLPIKTLCDYQHLSGIEDIIIKNNYAYLLQKCSTVCEYEIQEGINGPNMNFRRSLSAGYISMIRFPELTTNFSGVGCHIYGLSQIQITRKFKIEEKNIINVPEMISDFIVLESKETSEYFALCVFQNSSVIRIYSLISQEQVYELSSDYIGEVGVSSYLPKIEVICHSNKYSLVVISQSQFEEESNKVRVYDFLL